MRRIVLASLIAITLTLPALGHPRPRKHTHHGVAVISLSAPKPHPDRSQGWLELRIKPLPTRIWIDDQAVEPARRIPLTPGFHQLRLELHDGTIATREIKLLAGSRVRLGVDLR